MTLFPGDKVYTPTMGGGSVVLTISRNNGLADLTNLLTGDPFDTFGDSYFALDSNGKQRIIDEENSELISRKQKKRGNS